MTSESVGEWLDEWLKTVALARPRSLVSYRSKAAHMRPALGAIQLTELRSRDVRLALTGLANDGMSPSMLRHVFITLSIALNAAVAERRISTNPCQGMATPRKSYFEARTLTSEQAQRLVEVAWDTRLGPLLTVALSTGMRSGELLALTWADVDLDAGQITVNKSVQWKPDGQHVAGATKTRSGRRAVNVQGRALEALVEQRSRTLEVNSDLVFPAVDGGYWIPQGRFVDQFRALLAAAGCPQIRFHDLRHTAGLFLTRSVGVVVASRMLGHADPSITAKYYGHAAPEDFTAAARAMATVIGGPKAIDHTLGVIGISAAATKPGLRLVLMDDDGSVIARFTQEPEAHVMDTLNSDTFAVTDRPAPRSLGDALQQVQGGDRKGE